jgi:hypothetical protein
VEHIGVSPRNFSGSENKNNPCNAVSPLLHSEHQNRLPTEGLKMETKTTSSPMFTIEKHIYFDRKKNSWSGAIKVYDGAKIVFLYKSKIERLSDDDAFADAQTLKDELLAENGITSGDEILNKKATN